MIRLELAGRVLDRPGQSTAYYLFLKNSEAVFLYNPLPLSSPSDLKKSNLYPRTRKNPESDH